MVDIGDIVQLFLKNAEGEFDKVAAQVVKIYDDAHGNVVHDLKVLVADVYGIVHKKDAVDPTATKVVNGDKVPDTSPAVSHITEVEPSATSSTPTPMMTSPSQSSGTAPVSGPSAGGSSTGS